MIIEAFLLALALCVDSFVVSATSAFKSKMSYRRGCQMALIFAFCQGLFPLAGAVLGVAFRSVIDAVDHWIAFALLLAVGGKMIVDGIRDVPKDEQMDMSKTGVLFLLGVATSIDAFVVGIGIGLDKSMREVLVIVGTIFFTTYIMSIIGLCLGKRNVPIPDRAATIMAGIVLVSLGAFTLVEHFAEL